MGMEIDRPIVTDTTLEWNYTNEGGVEGRTNLLKNIMGLWLVQECKREWDRGGKTYAYEDLVQMAETASPFLSFIDPDDDSFYSPGDMPRKIREYCAKTCQRIPQTKAEILRCIFESLAFKYRQSLERLESITQTAINKLHILGGGAKNDLLNQFSANAINRAVISGPAEATAIGNIMAQAIALGEVAGTTDAREVIRSSFPLREYVPRDAEQWDEAYHRYTDILI
jgi:sugar (pentulose or hexulose) kinase